MSKGGASISYSGHVLGVFDGSGKNLAPKGGSGIRIDRKSGIGGYWATQILPFGDPTSFVGYLDFETTAYATAEARAAA